MTSGRTENGLEGIVKETKKGDRGRPKKNK